jgi:hypothetical protein
MDKKSLSECDIFTQFILPALVNEKTLTLTSLRRSNLTISSY